MEDSFFNLIEPDVQEKFALFAIQSNELFELYYDPDIVTINNSIIIHVFNDFSWLLSAIDRRRVGFRQSRVRNSFIIVCRSVNL